MIRILSKVSDYLWKDIESEDSVSEDDYDFIHETQEEKKEIYGTVTSIDSGYGYVDDDIYFTPESVVDGYFPNVGDQIYGEAVRSHSSCEWTISILRQSELWNENDIIRSKNEIISYEDGVTKIIEVGKVTAVRYKKLKVNDIEYSYKECSFEICAGDWITMTLSDKDNRMVSKIVPSRQSHIEGEITGIGRQYNIINQEVCFDSRACSNGYRPNIGDHVHAEVIESSHNNYRWRAIKVRPSITPSHVINFSKFKIKEQSSRSNFIEKLLLNKNDIVVTEKLDFGVLTQNAAAKYITVWIRNNSVKVHRLSSCSIELVDQGNQFIIENIGIMQENGKSITVKISDSVNLYPAMAVYCNVMFSPRYLGKTRHLFTCEFEDFSIGRYIEADVQSKNQALLQPSETYVQKSATQRQSELSENTLIIPGEKTVRPKNFIPVRLPQFPIPKKLIDAINTRNDLLTLYSFLNEELSFRFYRQHMSLLLHLEEIQQKEAMREFDMHRICLRVCGEYLGLAVPGLAEKRPSVLIGDRVLLMNPMDSDGPIYEGFIHQVFSAEVFIKFNDGFHSKYNGEDYNIRFEFSRTSVRKCHQSVDIAFKLLGESVLFPSKLEPKVPQIDLMPDMKTFKNTVRSSNPYSSNLTILKNRSSAQKLQDMFNAKLHKNQNIFELNMKTISSSSVVTTPNFLVPNVSRNPPQPYEQYMKKDWRRPNGKPKKQGISWSNPKLNDRQRSAVRRILSGSSRPVPYVLFGPPGTGKTITVVEAVAQISKLVPRCRILVATPSNSAADLIVERLHASGMVKPEDMIRLNAFQRNLANASQELKMYCHENIEAEVAVHFRVIVGTCVTVGNFTSLGLKEGHFTHVFVDEAGQATEPECLIPLVLAAGPDCQVTLAGDPLQLGPIITSVPAKVCGLQTSLLERLMLSPLYRQNKQLFADHGSFNPLLVTKLVKSYRSHDAILKFSSEQFYDGELIAAGEADLVNRLTGFPFLKNSNFPVIFHGAVGENLREGDSPSWFNPTEVFQCVHYLRELLDFGVDASDIGIITPYKKQVEKIRFIMERLEIPSMKVGSVEEFQGQEKLIIILSTVRSSQDLINFDIKHHLGFLSNPKRFNVAVTRAQALLIVIGNPNILMQDQYWGKFISYCIENNSYIGCPINQEI